MNISSGSGKVDYAIVIAGVPDIWTTTTRLEQTLADGRQIRAGLQYQGLRIREEAHLRDAELDVAGIAFRVRNPNALAAFARRPAEVGQLRANWKSGNTFDASESTGFSAGDLVHINTAVYEVSSVSAPSSGTVTVTTTTDVDVPLRDTLAQYHYHTAGTRAALAPIYNMPGSLEGRRVYLYRFDSNEAWNDTSGVSSPPSEIGFATDKTPIWRGVIRQAPRLDSDGLTWIVETDSIVALLNQSVAGVDAPGRIRGAYYHKGCPFVVQVWQHSTDELSTVSQGPEIRWVTGFFETDAGFLKAVNDECDDIASTLTNLTSLKIEPSGKTYKLVAITDGTDPRYITMFAGSFVDGATHARPRDEDGREVHKVSADTAYQWPLADLATGHELGEPRVLLTSQGGPHSLTAEGQRILAFATGAPTNLYDTTTDTDIILHLASEPPTIDTSEIGTILIKDAKVQPQEEYNIQDATISQADRTINFGSVAWKPLLLDRNARIIFSRGTKTSEGLKEYRQHLIDSSVHANFGDTPFITSRDLASWDEAYDDAVSNGVRVQKSRSYVFEEAVDLYDMLRGEALLLGCFWRLDAEGKIELVRMTPPDVGGSGLTSIDTTNTVSPYGNEGAWPTWEPGGDGIANEIDVTLPLQDKQGTPGEARTYNIRLVESIGLRKSRGRGNAEIEVMSSSVARDTDAQEVATAISDYIGLMSTDYQRVTIPVTFDLFGVKVGDYVLVSNPHIPNVETGERGITNKQGLVVARDWPLDPADRAYGELTVVLFDTQLIGGYAPSFYYDTAVDQGGGVWRFTPGQTTPPAMWSDLWREDKVDVTDLFVVGDTVVVRPLASGGTVLEGTINAVTATGSGSTGEIDVDLGGSTPASEGLIDFVTGDTPSDVSDHQGAYAYVADAGGSLYSGRVYWKFA